MLVELPRLGSYLHSLFLADYRNGRFVVGKSPSLPALVLLNRFGPVPPGALFLLFFQQNCSDGHKEKIEDEQLRALPVRRANVALKNGVSEGKHHGKNQNRKNLPQLVTGGKPQTDDQEGKSCPPDNHFRQSNRLSQITYFPRKGGEQEIYQSNRNGAQGTFGS